MRMYMLIPVLLLFTVLPCRAAPETDIYHAADGVSAAGQADVRAILEDFSFQNAAEGVGAVANGSLLQRLWQGLVRFAAEAVRTNLNAPLSVAGIAVLCGILGNIKVGSGGVSEAGTLLAYTLCAGIAASSVHEIAAVGLNAVQDMTTFTGAAMPALAVLSAAAGGGAAVSLHPLLLAAGGAASLLIGRIGIPALYITLALSIIGNLSRRISLRALSELIRKAAFWVVCGSLTLFGAVISVSGYAAGTLGGLTLKTVKYAAGSLIPVLGSILSESAEAVSLGALTVKNTAGTAGMLFLLLLTAAPVLRTMLCSLLYRLAAAVAEPTADKRICTVLCDIADILAALAGMTAAAGALSVFTVGTLLKTADMGVMLQ